MKHMKKRIINKKRVGILIFCIIILAFILSNFISTLATNINYNRLKKTDYSNETLRIIAEKNLINIIVKNKYSKVLDVSIDDEDFDFDNLAIYYDLDYIDYEKFPYDLNDIIKKNYSNEEIIIIYDNFTIEELKLLANIDYIKNIEEYAVYNDFKLENVDRYISYKNLNNTLVADEVIMRVNLSLDYEAYEKITEIDNPSSTLVLVNKAFKLPTNYKPANIQYIDSIHANRDLLLRDDAKSAFENMATASNIVGLDLRASSTYRTYDYQSTLYNKYVYRDGAAVADTYSARPGHSEHQTGLAVDVSSGSKPMEEFENSNEYAWLINNAYIYGFILRYPEGKEDITGYKFEAWHFRFVGIEPATYIFRNKITFDEYYEEFIDIKKETNK